MMTSGESGVQCPGRQISGLISRTVSASFPASSMSIVQSGNTPPVQSPRISTMVSQLLAGFGSLLYAFRRNPYFRLSREMMKPNRKIIGNSVKLGLPLALQWSLIAISTTALQRVVNSFGPVAVAAYTATNRLEQLVQQPFGSLSMALSTYCGQNMGAGRRTGSATASGTAHWQARRWPA